MNNIFTEEEVIKITIENGYNGSEFETKDWKQRECLKPNRTLDALISKLQTIYNNVVVDGKGKKRRYILDDKKSEVTERIMNYKGSVATDEDDIMKEYIFNSLPNKSDFTQAYKGWADVLKFPDISELSVEDMIKKIKDVHNGFPRIYNPKEAVSKFIQTVNVRNKDVIEKSFKRLVDEGRIRVTEIYNFKTIDGDYKEVTELAYREAQDHLNEFLQSMDITYYSYTQSLTSFYKTQKMKEIIYQVDAYLAEKFDIEYFFKSFKVEVLDSTVKHQVSTDEFNQAYIQRLVKLSIDRQNKGSYKDSLQFWKRFYLLNTLTLLKFMGANVDEALAAEKKLQLEKTDEFDLDTTIHGFETLEDAIEREKRRRTFGSIEQNLPLNF